MINEKYKRACTEVYTILSYLNEEEYNKIDPSILETIKENMNEEYIFDIDWDIELKDQVLLEETRAILFNIFRDYLATSKQKELISDIQNKERQISEIEKKGKFGIDVFANDNKKEDDDSNQKIENAEMVVYKETLIKRIINKIKNFLKK